MRKILEEVADERYRQLSAKGYTARRDRRYTDRQLSCAAACYATGGKIPWPWPAETYKPKGYRRDLIRAMALLVAEVERIDEFIARPPEEENDGDL